MGRNGNSPVGIPWEWEWLQNWEGMGIDRVGMGGNGNVKSHSRSSRVQIFRHELHMH